MPKARRGSASDRGTTLQQNTLSVGYREPPKEAEFMGRTAGLWALTNPYRKPLDPGEPALGWMASLR